MALRVLDARADVSAKWENRYREVLDAAAMCFAERGYLGAGTREIAERLGIRAASLYYYLPSKEAALFAVCKLSVLDFIDNLRHIIAGSDRPHRSCAPRSPIIFCRCAVIRPPTTFESSSFTGTSCRMGRARRSVGWTWPRFTPARKRRWDDHPKYRAAGEQALGKDLLPEELEIVPTTFRSLKGQALGLVVAGY